MADIHCFVGPTLTAQEVAGVCPAASVRPPIAHGDLLSLRPAPGDIVVIIDGLYFQRPSVRHPEILHCIDRGVVVVGTASMGALRAAELHSLGVRGTGNIYRLYRRGILDGDDEVAVSHGDENQGYATYSEALVNVRATLRKAATMGVLTTQQAAELTDEIKTWPFARRTRTAIIDASDQRYGAERSRELATFLQTSFVDLKKRDAVHALRLLKRLSDSQGYRQPHGQTVYLRRWLDEASVADNPSPQELMNVARAFCVDYPEWQHQAATYWFAARAIETVSAGGIQPNPLWNTTLNAQGAARAAGLDRNIVDQYLRDTSPDQRFLKAESLAAQYIRERLGRTSFNGAPDNDHLTTLLAARSFYAGHHYLYLDPIYGYLASAGVCPALKQLVTTIRTFNSNLQLRRPDHQPGKVRLDAITEWLRSLWRRSEEDTDAKLATDRGFESMDNAARELRPYSLYGLFGKPEPLRLSEFKRAIITS